MSSLLSFLNKKLVPGTSRTPINDDDPVRQQWDDFMRLYQENERVFKTAETVDLVWAAKNEKADELEASVDSFADTASLVLEGLLRIVNLHPSFGVVVSAYYSLLKLDLDRARDQRKVLLVLLQIQATLSTLFQLRHIKKVTVRSEAERKSLQQLIVSLAMAITNCGSDLNNFMSASSPIRLIYVNTFEKTLLAHVNTFIKKRSDLQKLIDDILSLNGVWATPSIKDLGEKIMSLKISEKPQQAQNQFHIYKARFFARLRSKEEAEAGLLIQEKITNVKEDPKGAQSKFFDVYLEFVSKEDAYEQVGYIGDRQTLTKMLHDEGKKKMGTGDSSHFPRFSKLLDIQNRALERNLARTNMQTELMRQFDMKREIPFIISVSTLAGGKRHLLLDTPTTVKDPEVHQMWNLMNLGSNVEIRKFILKFREYIIDDMSSTEKWVLDYIDLAHLQPIAEALRSSASGSVNVDKVHQFALSRPNGLSVLEWFAYWSAGWRINIMNYRDQIISIMRQMHEAFESIHIANRAYVGVYLGSPFFIRIESLFRSVTLASAGSQESSPAADPSLVELAYHVAQLQEDIISANLKDVSFTLTSPGEARLVGGPERAETWILPLLHQLLQRHLAIINIAQHCVLDGREMMVHTQSLVSAFRVFEGRIKDLEELFKLEEKHDLERQFENFAYGMFSTYIDKKASMSYEKSQLSTFKNADAPPKREKSNAKRNPVDTSILAKGLGKPFEYKEIERTILNPNHPLQDAWYGKGLQIYLTSFNADHTFTGTGQSLTYAINKVMGKVEPVMHECPDGCLIVDFKLVFDEFEPVMFKGLYDPDKDTIEVETTSRYSDLANTSSSQISQFKSTTITFTRAIPSVSRFKFLLKESKEEPTLTLARRRWAFATQAILLQVQTKMKSIKVFRRGFEDRRTWLENTAVGDDDDDPGSEHLKKVMVLANLTPENIRLYNTILIYLIHRLADSLGGVRCDGCDKIIRNTRFSCITCRDENIEGNGVDLCTNCVDTPQLSERYRDRFAHHISHSLIRTSSFIPHFEISELVCQAKVLSEDIKRLFRNPFADKSLKCACCDTKVTLPCLVCIICSLHPVICTDCDANKQYIRRDHASFSIHSHRHRLLRIFNSEASPSV